jgi:hypothetical protein
MLSLLSRTSHRKMVKKALRGDLNLKLDTLDILDLTQITELGKSNMSWSDYLKTMSFQIGQTLALLDGTELYCKESIAKEYPGLEPYLKREVDADLQMLQFAKSTLVFCIKDLGMTKLFEY